MNFERVRLLNKYRGYYGPLKSDEAITETLTIALLWFGLFSSPLEKAKKIEKPCNDQLRLIDKLIGINRNKVAVVLERSGLAKENL